MKPLCCSDFSRDSLSNLTGKILRVTGNSFRVTGKFHLQTCFGRRPSPGTKSRPTNRQLVHFIAAPPMQPFQQVCSHPRLGITNLAEAPAGGGSRPRQRTSEAHIGLLSRLSRRKSLCAFSLNKLSVRVATPMVLGNETGELSMIEGISAITLGTHEMHELSDSIARRGLRSCTAAKTRHSPAFEQERAILTSSSSPPTGAGPGGGGWRACSARNCSPFSAHALPDTFPRPENRFLRSYFREYEFRHCTDSTELAHVQMGNDPIAPFKHRVGQHDLQLFIGLSRIIVQNSDTCTAPNRFELTNSRRAFSRL